ncbi:unnamed protein product [Trichobilharzia regenti]|nr:unnamed protein product [Trichobilharzia regenti]
MSIFRNFLSCISIENISWPFVNNNNNTNPLRTDTSYHSNNNNNNNYNTFPKNSCIICHESVDTCLRNQSSKCHRHSFRLLDTTRRKSLKKTSKQSTESQYNIQTTQPKTTMTTVCATGTTDTINILVSFIPSLFLSLCVCVCVKSLYFFFIHSFLFQGSCD